ncbi:hypothetical protein [Bacillus sp. AK031]
MTNITRIKRKTLKDWGKFIFITFMILGGTVYYTQVLKPKNSLDLYQSISSAEDFEEAQDITLEGYEKYFKEEDFEYIQDNANQAESIKQFTLFEYEENTYLIMTTPGTESLKVLSVEELPKEVRSYFLKTLPE